MNKFVGMMLVFFIAVIFTGCETTKGVGQDIENLGHEIDESV